MASGVLRGGVRRRRGDFEAIGPGSRASLPRERHLGWGTIRMYGFGSFQSPKTFFASSLDTEPAITTSSPGFQLTGVATRGFAVSCSESMTRNTSSKLRPVVIG